MADDSGELVRAIALSGMLVESLERLDGSSAVASDQFVLALSGVYGRARAELERLNHRDDD
jgi:hypothetical protein